ncbi:MAG: signal peptide peptidase SppA [Syntrophales bacterium]|nr:signal peptide peptidase SppA [Syntrophales bacterium]MDD5642508.1 signal peptide peptidase SppA [Syntrophales bacterium]
MLLKELGCRCLALFLVLLVTGCVTVKVDLFEESKPLKEKVISGFGRDKILLVDVSGMIVESRPRGLLSLLSTVTTPDRIKEVLDKAAQDSHIKAVVLRINSPGGTVSASDIIHHELMKYKKETGVPVVACLMGLATSGGYYLAQAGDTIVANPSGITGSIGVLAMKLNVKGLMDKVGVEGEMVKSGKWKDFWSPFRPATPEEKQMMQGVINSYYQGFVDVVAQGRKMDLKEVRRVADGRIYTASQAKDLGLVDTLGYLDDAIDLAKKKAGLEEAKVVRYQRPDSYRPNIYSGLPDFSLAVTPQFLYMWWPGEL